MKNIKIYNSLIFITATIFSTTSMGQSGNFFKDLENAAKQLNQITQQTQNKNEAPSTTPEKNLTLNNQKKESNSNDQEKAELLMQFATILWMDRYTFSIMENQLNFNVKYGGPPVTNNHKKMLNNDIPSLWKDWSTCSVKLGGEKINEGTIKNYLLTSKDKTIADLRAMYKLSENSGAKESPPRVPKRSDLNDAPNMENQTRLQIKQLTNALKMQSNQKWCEDFRP